MGAFKDELSPGLAGTLADELVRAWPEFPRARFVRGIAAALAPLELLARVDLLVERLAEALPDDFETAAAVLRRALESETFTGWLVWPCTAYVARAGLDHPGDALPLLAALTPRASSEFAVRPFVERHPEVTYEHLHWWAADPDEHVRRLVSEGTRPRLPWAPRLRALVADPAPNVPLLDLLAGDPSAYVRRSVANHLNDIAKDHPDLALDLARRWLPRGPGPAWVVRHGLRSLVKQGHPEALALLGADHEAPVRLTSFTVAPGRVRVGEEVVMTCTLVLDGDDPADAIVDYRVHYAGAAGPRAPKVFKLTRRRLAPGRPVTITRRHAFANVSIRAIRPGRHTVDVQVNGRVLGSATVDVDP